MPKRERGRQKKKLKSKELRVEALRFDCASGKLSYLSRKDALKALNRQLQAIHRYGGTHREDGRLPKTVYQCPECKYWHFTGVRAKSA